MCSPASTTTIIFTAQVSLFPSSFLPLLLLLSTLSLIQMLACVGADSTCNRTTNHSQGAFADQLAAQESACGTAQQSWAEIFHVALWFARVICYGMATVPTSAPPWCCAAVDAHFVVVIGLHVVFVVSTSLVGRFMASVRPYCRRRWWYWHWCRCRYLCLAGSGRESGSRCWLWPVRTTPFCKRFLFVVRRELVLCFDVCLGDLAASPWVERWDASVMIAV
jgi:hypothetical protein